MSKPDDDDDDDDELESESMDDMDDNAEAETKVGNCSDRASSSSPKSDGGSTSLSSDDDSPSSLEATRLRFVDPRLTVVPLPLNVVARVDILDRVFCLAGREALRLIVRDWDNGGCLVRMAFLSAATLTARSRAGAATFGGRPLRLGMGRGCMRCKIGTRAFPEVVGWQN